MILDSNIIIYFGNPVYGKLRHYLQASSDPIYVSLISKLEVLGYHKLKPFDKEQLENLLNHASILPLTDAIITEAVRLRQQRKRSLGDSIIAATALLYELPLLTNNTVDFEDIPNLRLISLQSII